MKTSVVLVLLLVCLGVGFYLGHNSNANLPFNYTLPSSSSSVSSQGLLTTVYVQTQITGQQIVEYCFSPGGRCDRFIIKYINAANQSIHIVIYSFTMANIKDALVAAKRRGVEVEMVCDKGQWSAQGSQCPQLENQIDVRRSSNTYLTHDKFMVVDGKFVLTGSYNWTQSATGYGSGQGNDENLIVISDMNIASSYDQQFQRIYLAGT
jgi:phosphatidylserine/phosphatidylglycerophosphate/cardiolipin synthase-like enzyme